MSDWILATQAPLGFCCERCGARVTIGPSTPLWPSLNAGEAFRERHAACEPTPAAVEVRRAGGAPLPGFEP